MAAGTASHGARRERVPLAEAERLAQEVAAIIAPDCERVEIAGSIRRGKPDIGDVELVVLPYRVPITNLFGAIIGWRNRLDEHVGVLLAAGTFGHRLDKNGRHAAGERYKRLTYKGLGLDLFSAIEPAQFGLILTIRTGPADFSHKLVTQRRFGGYRPDSWQVKDGALWDDRGELVPTPDERDVFAALGLDWIEPAVRA